MANELRNTHGHDHDHEHGHHHHHHDHEHGHHHHHHDHDHPEGFTADPSLTLRPNIQDEFYHRLLRERPREAELYRRGGLNRRSFLKLMGASLALSGLGLTGCTIAPPDEQILPYANMPEQMVPGEPLFFATSMVLGGYATGVLIETHQGRPTRLEGNPQHPASLGSSDPIIQASILELYNPDRSILVRNGEDAATWAQFTTALADALEDSGNGGEGLRILTEQVTSPTLANQINAVLARYPNARWYQYEPVARDNVVAGSRLAFDDDVNTVYNFAAAQTVVTLDADFFTKMPGHIAYANDFMSQRKVRDVNGTMNRLYAIESTPTNTGVMADHRLRIRARDVETFARGLASALGVEGVTAPNNVPGEDAFFEALVADLQAGPSVVVPGDNQPPIVHALAHAINATLGNVGTTVIYTPSVLAQPVITTREIVELTQEMQEGDVDTLLILGGNPAYNAPADVPFAAALGNVRFSAHTSLYVDETSALTTWHVPATHFIEEWGDARAFDGTASVIQPPIGPLWDTVHSPLELLGLVTQDERSPYEMVRATWEANIGGGDFEAYWRKALHDGVLADTSPEPITPSLRGDFATQIGDIAPPANNGGLEIIFRPDPAIWDGRFASNSWLQELPDPLTTVTWDNAALLSPATAARLGIASEDLIDLDYAGRIMQVPAWTLPGHPDDAVTISLGYGRGISSELDDGRNFSAYQIRTANAPWFDSGLNVNNAGSGYSLAQTQPNTGIEDISPVEAAALPFFRENPTFAQKKIKDANAYPGHEYDSYAWGMSIDMTSCMGCNACVTACQMENNIPTVGKQEVLQAREMFWIRLDRYHREEDDGDVQTFFQPIPCMHCEQAPCEQVCPVQATVHGDEGLNQMIYNRCIGTRYCSANCPYGVRRFNFFEYTDPNPIMVEWRNPDVSVRPRGVMEKCTYCVQRINAAHAEAGIEDRRIRDGEIQPACAVACPTNAIVFGDINDGSTQVAQLKASPLNYGVLAELNTVPRTTYLARLSNPNEALYTPPSDDEAQ